jgi:hypothetical protein
MGGPRARTCHSSMWAVASSQHREPMTRWNFTARSKGTPKAASHTELRATGNARKAIVSVVRWPLTRAATWRRGYASASAAASLVMRVYRVLQNHTQYAYSTASAAVSSSSPTLAPRGKGSTAASAFGRPTFTRRCSARRAGGWYVPATPTAATPSSSAKNTTTSSYSLMYTTGCIHAVGSAGGGPSTSFKEGSSSDQLLPLSSPSSAWLEK